MTDQEINIAIAEACGWHHIIKDDEWGPDRALKPDQKFEMGCAFTNIPDYCNDLNSMHEAEKVLTADQKYANLRFIAPDWKDWTDGKAYLKITYATARERAEAFLRTLGKWKE